MKKYLILALVLMFAAGSAFAADEHKHNFKMSGQYRLEAYNMDDTDYNSAAEDNVEFFDQRFRLGFSFNPAEGVNAFLRADFAETNWNYNYRPAGGQTTIMVDRAYVDIQKGFLNIKGGLMSAGLGKSVAVDYQSPHIVLKADFAPIQIIGLFMRTSEGGANTDDTTANEDDSLYGAEVKFSSGAFAAGAFFAVREFGSAEDTLNVVGLHGSTTLGPLALWAELDVFGGDRGPGAADIVGTNVSVNGEMAIGESVTAGINVNYAPGTDAGNEEQITFLTDDWGYTPMDWGPFQWIQSTGIDIHEVEANAGALGFNIYGKFAAMEGLTIFANAAYLTPAEEDPENDGTFVESYTVGAIGASYVLLPGASLNFEYRHIGRSGTGIDDDPASKIQGMLKVNF